MRGSSSITVNGTFAASLVSHLLPHAFVSFLCMSISIELPALVNSTWAHCARRTPFAMPANRICATLLALLSIASSFVKGHGSSGYSKEQLAELEAKWGFDV